MRFVLVAFTVASFFSGLFQDIYATGGEQPVLYVLTWEGYISPRAIRLFEEKTGARVEQHYYDSNEVVVEKLREGGGYDVITPAGFAIEGLREEGLIRELDHSLLPNLRYVHPGILAMLQDSEMRHSVPYTVTLTVVGYNPSMVPPDALGSWDIFADARLSGRVTMMNDLRETIGAALKYRGHSLNSSVPLELEEAGRVLHQWKKNVALFSVDEARYGLRDGKYGAIQTYYGDLAQVLEENPSLRYFVPREGTSFNTDKFVIGVDSEYVGLSHAFIDHFLDPEVAALNMRDVKYLMPNTGALERGDALYADHPALTLPEEVRERCEMVRYLPPDVSARYDGIWADVLIGDD